MTAAAPVGSFGRAEGHHATVRKTPEGWDEPACTCLDPQCIPPGTRRAASHEQAVEWAAHILEGRASS